MKINNLDNRRNISGRRIRQRRVKKGLSQSQLAAKVQVLGVILEQDAISRIESGGRMVQDYELWAFAQALGVSADDLMEPNQTE